MIDLVVGFAVATGTFNSIFGICLYWLPMVICIVGYTIRTARNIQKDKRERIQHEKNEIGYYSPTDTIGDLIGRSLVSIIPIANLWSALFDISPMLFDRLFKWVSCTFNQPLVPIRNKTKDKETE